MKNWTDYPLVLNSDQVSEILGLHLNTVKSLAKKGIIPARKVGRNWRYDREAIREWLAGKNE